MQQRRKKEKEKEHEYAEKSNSLDIETKKETESEKTSRKPREARGLNHLKQAQQSTASAFCKTKETRGKQAGNE